MATIPRTLLVRRLIKNPFLLEVLTERALGTLKIGGIRKVTKDNSGVQSLVLNGVSSFLSFYTAIIVETAEQVAFDESRLRHIYPYLAEGLKTHFNPSFARHQTQCLLDWKLSCCIIVTQLSKKTRFGAPLCRALSKCLAVALLDSKSGSVDHTRSTISYNIMVTASFLCQQGQLEITPKFLFAIYKNWEGNSDALAWLFDTFNLLGEYETTSLVSCIVWSTFKCLIREEKDTDDWESGLSSVNLGMCLCRCIQQALLPEQVGKDLLNKILLLIDDGCYDDDIVAEFRRLIKSFSYWLPATFDFVLQPLISSRGSTSKLVEFLAGTFADASHYSFDSPCDNLFISLCSPIRELRVQALRSYASKSYLSEGCAHSSENIALAEAAMKSLVDSDYDVARCAWHKDLVSKLTQSVSFQDLLSHVDQALEIWTNYDEVSIIAENSNLVICQVFESICSEDFIDRCVAEGKSAWLISNIFSFIFACVYGFISGHHVNILLISMIRLLNIAKMKISVFKYFDAENLLSKDHFMFDIFLEGVVKCISVETNYFRVFLDLATSSMETYSAKHEFLTATIILLFGNVARFGVCMESALKNELMQLIVGYSEDVQMKFSAHVLKFLFSECGSLFDTIPSTPVGPCFWNLVVDESVFPDFKVRIAKSVIRSSDMCIVSLMDLCLETLFPGYYIEFLLRLMLTEHEQFQVLIVNLLLAFVGCKGKLKTSNDEILLICGLIGLWSCGSSDRGARKLGLAFCSRLLESLEDVNDFTTSFFQNSGKTVAISVDVNSLRQACILLKEKSSLIMLDPLSAQQAIKEGLNEAQHSQFRQYIWSVLSMVCWKFPSFSLPLLRMVNDSSIDVVYSVYCSILNDARGDFVDKHLLNCFSDFMVMNFSNGMKETQSAIVSFFTTIIKEEENSENRDLKHCLLSMLGRGLLKTIDLVEQNTLYEMLMDIQLSRPGDAGTLDALSALNIQPDIPLKMITSEVIKMNNLSMLESNEPFDLKVINGKAVPLHRLVALLEATVPTILKFSGLTEYHLSNLLVQLFTALEITGRSQMKSILSIEYYKAVILEALSQSFQLAERKQFQLFSPVKLDGGTNIVPYSVERTEKDLSVVMQCLGSLKSIQIQGPAFVVLQSLIKLNPVLTLLAIRQVGELLSSPITYSIGTREKFLSTTLEFLINLFQVAPNVSGEDPEYCFQIVMQSLCLHLPTMSVSHRMTLLRTALKVCHREKYANSIVIHVLLAHTFSAYEIEHIQHGTKTFEVEEICLSRSSQRRAQRVTTLSGPEEYFSLAKSLFFEWSSHEQISVLSHILNYSFIMLKHVAQSKGKSEPELLHVSSTVAYVSQLIGNTPENNCDADLIGGFSATLTLLHLEFVLDVMESKRFHRQQVKVFSASSIQLQRLFLEVADGVLKLIASTDSMKKDSQVGSALLVKIRFEDKSFQVSLKYLLDIVLEWSLECLHSLQRLLDGPSFICIMQELFSHEMFTVRQKAVHVLKDRLQQMLVEKSIGDECVLYFDLSSKMRSIVVEYLGKYVPLNEQNIDAQIDPVESALAQSSIMCLDVLIQYLGKAEEWRNELINVVQELLHYIPSMYSFCAPRNGVFNASAKALDTKKLLGSVLLCCSTAFKMLHVGSLPFLPAIIESLISIFKAESLVWRSFKDDQSIGITDVRAHVLFARSIISSLNLVIVAMPCFIHPYLKILFQMMLDSFVAFNSNSFLKELKGLCDDASSGLNIIATKIPPRLLIPALSNCICECVGGSHNGSYRMVQLVLQVAKATDRSASLTHLTKWMTIFFELLDYRRKHGDFTTDTDSVEETICDSVVVLCLKLTESELKTFILKIVEWKGGVINGTQQTEVEVLRRSRTFYVLIKSLIDKLKILFYPTMSLLWKSLVQDLDDSRTKVLKIIESTSDSQTKKRKRFEHSKTLDKDTEGLLGDYLSMATMILGTLQSLCETSSSPFINQVFSSYIYSVEVDTSNFFQSRYEEIFPLVLSFLTVRYAFALEDNFLQFVKDYVASSLGCLCLTTTRDILWKPINHQVLLQTRHEHPSVRKGAILTLQHLFEVVSYYCCLVLLFRLFQLMCMYLLQQVGEEYILLLPECLPFISELLEDDNADVVACVRSAILSIEELSGESLDAYLKN